ncbi:uncharacterized protein LOC128403389 isoform X3 [Podarcis raffonei]|uniref:uncharacterized protein LOC128403389 isoform X3 n=1 Tax=Podarcis raffonei TaxID=65483 RepID=UPI0023297FD4|nr:uncharacterized protein LOC128403389 isoform X3 [Podarcis raffonei]
MWPERLNHFWQNKNTVTEAGAHRKIQEDRKEQESLSERTKDNCSCLLLTLPMSALCCCRDVRGQISVCKLRRSTLLLPHQQTYLRLPPQSDRKVKEDTCRSLKILLVFKLLIYSSFEPVPRPWIQHKVQSKTPEGCNVSLQCQAPVKEEYTISWKRGNPPRVLVGGLDKYWLSDNGRNLHVSWRKSSSDSTFTCLVSNPVDRNRASFDLLRICASGEGGQQKYWGILPLLVCAVGTSACLIMIWKKKKLGKKKGRTISVNLLNHLGLSLTAKCVPASPLLLLRVCFQEQFKVLVLTFKAQNGLGPADLKEHLHPHLSARTLRCSTEGLLEVPSL